MGLAERKAAKRFEEAHYPRLEQELDAAAGFELARVAPGLAPARRGTAPDGDPLRAFLDWNVRGVDAALHTVARIAGRQREGIPLVLTSGRRPPVRTLNPHRG